MRTGINSLIVVAMLLCGLTASAVRGAPEDQDDAISDGQADAPLATAGEQAQPPGEALYQQHCANCHDQPFYKAPSRMFISGLSPASLLRVMNEGLMQSQSADIAPQDRAAIAEYLSGKALADVADPQLPPSCDADHQFDASKPPVSVGWGVDLHNNRFQSRKAGGLTAENISQLEVKWVFAYPNAFQARSEPVYGGGAVFVGSQDGTVWALDEETGCLRWRYNATAEVRTGVVISQWEANDANADPTIYFGDTLANTYAVSVRTGELRWKIKADDHRDATSTGTPKLAGDRLYIPVSSLEVVSAANPAYQCCTFRGALLAVDAASGEVIWKSHTVDKEPSPSGKNSIGTTIMGPSGAPIWGSPVVDLDRGAVYVATGQNYSSPADGNSDAIIAFDIETGKKRWVSQQRSRDAWNVACFVSIPGLSNANCPEEDGPDYDFGSHTILMTMDSGRQLVVGGQKSGEVVGVDPQTGKTVWKTRVGRGGIQGGVHFGIAAQGQTLYVPINDLEYPVDDARYEYTMEPRPGVYAVDASDGSILWSALAPDDVCGDLQFCDRGVSQAVTAIPGAVIAGHLDGRVRVYARESGDVIWEMNMLRDYESVSGEVARGGAFSGGGVLVANGRLYINAGYGYNNHIPGNALVVLGLPEESEVAAR